MPDSFARLSALHPKKIDLSLERMARILAALGHPERALPPVIHVAGTNGKGSVIAFLRALSEAAGLTAHIYTSPHLVRFNERIMIAGQEISDEAFAQSAARVERANCGAPLTFFEAMTAAAFLAFSEVKADFCLLETGLGGRLDATNMIAQPAMTIITPISYDHQAFLGARLAEIAAEKAGIIKSSTPLVLAAQEDEALQVVAARAQKCSSPLFYQGRDWQMLPHQRGFVYRFDGRSVELDLPAPSLLGAHQMTNAALALTAMHILRPSVIKAHGAAALRKVQWPARLQRIAPDFFDMSLSLSEAEIFLDGGHNPAAGAVLADFLRAKKETRKVFLICALRASKDMKNFIHKFAGVADALYAVPLPLYGRVPGEGAGAYEPDEMIKIAKSFHIRAHLGSNVFDVLKKISQDQTAQQKPPLILIAGSLLLAGDVLAALDK